MDQSDFLIDTLDILAFAGGAEKRNFIEGFAVANAKHLMYVGITKLKDNEVEIMALCLRNSDLTTSILELNLKISYASSKKSIKCNCSCPAGIEGQCKHSTALLVHLSRYRSLIFK